MLGLVINLAIILSICPSLAIESDDIDVDLDLVTGFEDIECLSLLDSTTCAAKEPCGCKWSDELNKCSMY